MKETQNPFGQEAATSFRPQFPIFMFFLLIVICFVFMIQFALAAMVPEIGSLLRDILGGERMDKTPERSRQLTFLMVCYSAPLVTTGLFAIGYYGFRLLFKQREYILVDEETSPFD